MIVNVYDAKTNLSGLLDKVLAGEDVVIARNGEPIVQLSPFVKRKKWVGMDKGKGRVLDNFEDSLADDEMMKILLGETE
jgi:prevent-host-death family protein